jgi:hypothetical protein
VAVITAAVAGECADQAIQAGVLGWKLLEPRLLAAWSMDDLNG